MLNISNNSIDRDEILKDQSAYKEVMESNASKRLIWLLTAVFFIGFTILFFPWTQNIRVRGKLTTLNPEDREQNIHSMISGRVEKWYVNEGQLVKKGDTIVFISEMKQEYLDPQLIKRSENQTRAKSDAMASYDQKVKALDRQIEALKKNQKLKAEQAKNYLIQSGLKVRSDSIDFTTALVNLEIAEKQFARQETLYKQGLKSLTELENRKQKLQEQLNKKISVENKWFSSKNEYINAKLSLISVENEYREKIAKAQSEKMSALSSSLMAMGDYNKLATEQTNYKLRSGFYTITAPQDGYVTKALIAGIGETVKEGQAIFSFIPADYELAAELYVMPIDLPLIHEGSKVQLQFDGWPAFVFRGWPGFSFGTFTGQVVAYDRAASEGGKFRVLVMPHPDATPWPKLLRLGSGAYGIALLNKVPVWYELWRQLNGFPPDFYEGDQQKEIVK